MTRLTKFSEIEKYAFSFITNCTLMSSGSKLNLWKNNLLQDFINNYQQTIINGPKINYNKEKLWLEFLVSLSLNHDGQSFIMKSDSLLQNIFKSIQLVDSNTGVNQHKSQEHLNLLINNQYLSLLILRNLASNPSNKSKLISNSNSIMFFQLFILLNFHYFKLGDFITIIVDHLKCRNESIQLTISCLDSLICDYQKVNNYYIDLKNTRHLFFKII
jgi:hypothetical protein